MRGILYCRPSDIVTATATIALTSGSENAAFPLTNVYDKRPGKVFKATGTSATIRLTYGAPQTLEGFSFLNHNLAGATVSVTNNATLNQSFGTIAAAEETGPSRDPFKDLRGLANVSATQWNLVISGAAANVAIGEIIPIATVRSMLVLPLPDEGEALPAIQHQLVGGDALNYPIGTRGRHFTGKLLDEADRLSLITLRRDALGVGRGFWFMPDADVNESYFMVFRSPDTGWQRWTSESANAVLDLVEAGTGLGVAA
jgi:hypothetical protein